MESTLSGVLDLHLSLVSLSVVTFEMGTSKVDPSTLYVHLNQERHQFLSLLLDGFCPMIVTYLVKSLLVVC